MTNAANKCLPDAHLQSAHHTSSHTAHGVLLFNCRDQLGVTASIAKHIADNKANLTSLDLFIDQEDPYNPNFHSRVTFSFNEKTWPDSHITEDIAALAAEFAAKTTLYIPGITPQKRLGILVSKQDHCLMDLLNRWELGKLDCRIQFVASNHPQSEVVLHRLARFNIPFVKLPTSPDDKASPDQPRKQEQALLQLAKDTDFLVLARYMQVLSGAFLKEYNRDVINIHHGLLPSFKGANPYRQAFNAGVKMIGATSHFVTEELDSGPIIEQLVDRVSHRDDVSQFAIKSKTLEMRCLTDAVTYFLDNRLIRYGTQPNERVMTLN